MIRIECGPCRIPTVWNPRRGDTHYYCDVIMSAIRSQITGVSIVCSTVCLCADQRKHQSPASLAFVRGIHWSPVDSPHKGPSNSENVPIRWLHRVLSIFTRIPAFAIGIGTYMQWCIPAMVTHWKIELTISKVTNSIHFWRPYGCSWERVRSFWDRKCLNPGCE